jgi:hypothetical protein
VQSVLKILIQISLGLDTLDLLKFLRPDLKPGNVFLDGKTTRKWVCVASLSLSLCAYEKADWMYVSAL